MSISCAKCGLADQLTSVDAIMAQSAYSSSQSTGVIVSGGDITPVLRTTNYQDKGLEALQKRITSWVNEPLVKYADPKRFRKLNGWMIILGSNFASSWIMQMSLGRVSDGGTMLAVIVLSLAVWIVGVSVGIWYLVTLKKRMAAAGEKNASATDRAESRHRADGWYCHRCNMLTPAS